MKLLEQKIQAFSVFLETVKLFTNYFTSLHFYAELYMRKSRLSKSKMICKVMQIEGNWDTPAALVGATESQPTEKWEEEYDKGMKNISWPNRGMCFKGREQEGSQQLTDKKAEIEEGGTKGCVNRWAECWGVSIGFHDE